MKHKNGNKYKILAYDSYGECYLLKRVCYDKKTCLDPFVVANFLENSNEGIHWGQGAYFVTEKSARAYFAKRFVLSLTQENFDVLFEEIYDDVGSFSKFKIFVKNEKPYAFKQCTEKEWNLLYEYFMSKYTNIGFSNIDLLEDLEDKLYDIRENDEEI